LQRLVRSAIYTLVLLVLVAGSAFADGERIIELLVKGNRRIETGVILNAVRLKAGDAITNEKVDADVRAIYKLGHFDDVAAEVEKNDKGVILVYRVAEKAFVREIRFVGNDKIGADKLRQTCELKLNNVFSPKVLALSVQKLTKAYHDEGYFLASVVPSTEKRPDGGVTVVFKITEGEKILIKIIRFEGNKVFTDKRLKKVMETGEAWFLSWITDAGTYKEEVAKNDANLIADLYYNNGYITAKVSEPKVDMLQDKSGLVLTFTITEGDQYRVGALAFKGELLESEEELAKKTKLKAGEVFSREVLRSDIATLTDLYTDRGYAYANITPQTKIDPRAKTIDITFDCEKGEKVYIDRININGNTKSRDKVIRREMKLAEGDLYSSTAIKKSKQQLKNLGFFEEVNIATAKGSGENKLDVNVDVKEKPTGTFSVGAGYSSLDGVIGQGSVQQANFLGLGLKANLSAAIGGKSQTYNIGLTDPYFLDTRWTLGSDIYRTERDYVDYKRRATGGDIKAGYPLSDTLSTFWVYKYEEKKIYDESAALQANINSGLIPPPATNSTTSSILGSVAINNTDYRLDPTSGMINNLSIEYAGLGGTNRFVRYIGNTQVFFPFKWGTVFSIRGEFGYIEGVGKDVPIDEKFYLGGINTIRGYNGRTVSPYRITTVTTKTFVPSNNPLGQTPPFNQFFPTAQQTTTSTSRAFIGGDTEAFMNFEYQFPVIKEAQLKGVVFFDIGNSYESIDQAFSRFQASYGFGLRWFSPMGPLRLEYGIPVNPRSGIDGSSGKIEFSMGSFF